MNNPPPNFRSLAELTSYLGELEERVTTLETENGNLRAKMGQVSEDGCTKIVGDGVPFIRANPLFWGRAARRPLPKRGR